MGIFFNPGNEGGSTVVSSQLYVDKTGQSKMGNDQR